MWCLWMTQLIKKRVKVRETHQLMRKRLMEKLEKMIIIMIRNRVNKVTSLILLIFELC